MTFNQLDPKKNVTQTYIHTFFSDFGVDPTLPSLFRAAELGFLCLKSEDLEPKEICNK